jgi:hypothetical protein
MLLTMLWLKIVDKFWRMTRVHVSVFADNLPKLHRVASRFLMIKNEISVALMHAIL